MFKLFFDKKKYSTFESNLSKTFILPFLMESYIEVLIWLEQFIDQIKFLHNRILQSIIVIHL